MRSALQRRAVRAEIPKPRQILQPREQPGYYPGYHTLSQQAFWDEATRSLILRRVEQTPPIRFFSGIERQTMEAVTERILPQSDRAPHRRIPIAPIIDDRLFHNRIDGFRYEDMPSDQDAYRWGLAAIDAMSHTLYAKSFYELESRSQDEILRSIHDCKPLVPHDAWKRMNVRRFWALLVQDCIEAYYAHPWAWDEIGFGGPAYPRAYMRLEGGKPEPWEKDEVRYEWHAPSSSISDRYEPIGGEGSDTHPGQEGTH